MKSQLLVFTQTVVMAIGLSQLEAQHEFFFPDALIFHKPYHHRVYTPRNSQDTIDLRTDSITSNEDYTQVLTRGLTNLTISLQKVIRRSDIAYGPVSIASAMVLLFLASNGRTYEEIAQVLGITADVQQQSRFLHDSYSRLFHSLQSVQGDTAEIRMASGIFVQADYPIRPIYRQIATALYGSQVDSVDFRQNSAAAQSRINAWVWQKTGGKIKGILNGAPPPHTKVVIASAMYFKAQWEQPFFAGTTKRKPFYPNGRQSPTTAITVDMMTNGGHFRYYNDTQLQCEIMAYPYRANQTVMYVLLPWNSNQERLAELSRQITGHDLNRLIHNLRFHRAVTIFPRMTLDTTIDLNGALRRLDASSLFDPNAANFGVLSPGLSNHERTSTVTSAQQVGVPSSSSSVNDLDALRRQLLHRRADGNGIYTSSIVHRVVMDVTETGTEAASATVVSLARDGGSISFRVDVPFLFCIRHEPTENILFWGSITRPRPYYDNNQKGGL